jgi:alkylation response protein AidB-like acyl-CoA dehydrogenase
VELEIQYHPSADQLALANTIEESMAELLPLSRVHKANEEDNATWTQLEEIGIFAIGLRPEDGGSGLGAVEEALIAMALGRRLAAPAVFATMGATHGSSLRGKPLERGKRVSSGYRRGGRVVFVNDSPARKVLVRSSSGAELFDLPEGAHCPVDARLWLGDLREVSAPDPPLASFDDAGLLRLRLLDAAALAGIAQAALDMGVAYAGTREQFGRPIGSLQAVKHHCANMAISARCARDQTAFAAVAVDQGRDDATFQVESAMFVAGTAALENAGKNIQIHGGLGFSDEADPHLLIKRGQLLLAVAGGLEAANDRIANSTLSW